MKITIVQPPYYAGESPDVHIAEMLIEEMKTVEKDSLLVLPEYANAGGLNDAKDKLKALPRAQEMKTVASKSAKENQAYISVNLLEEREGKLRNSTYLFGKNGKAIYIYDKIHLPPSEVSMGIVAGNGECCCCVDDIGFGFLTCYDVYYSEQIEYIAKQKPDILIVPGYQRGERTDIIRAQAKIAAFRCNAYMARASYSMDNSLYGGCSMLVAPDGQILADMEKEVGRISQDVNIHWKYMRSAGFGQAPVRNDAFISSGLRPDLF